MKKQATSPGLYDYVIIGSGFGGSVSALRLAEKGYRVLVLERGKRFEDDDFPRSNWNVWRFLWMPALRWFGIMQMSMLRGLFVLSGSGVGGGSLTYANVLMEPGDDFYHAKVWSGLEDWKNALAPHFLTAKRMLGVEKNPRLCPADHALQIVAEQMNRGSTYRATEVGIFFGEPQVEVKDPYFDGKGPSRSGCHFCGGCMVGCRHNAKNTLVKNYLYLAEKRGVEIRPESEVISIEPVNTGKEGRYRIRYTRTTGWFGRGEFEVHARNVIVAAGVLGTLSLLLRCRDVDQSLPNLSRRLGDDVRTNSESLLGSTSFDRSTDYSQGISIGSCFFADDSTQIQPVRYPDGSSLIRLLTSPLVEPGKSKTMHLLSTLIAFIRHPVDHLYVKLFARWAKRTTILLVMQTIDTRLKMRLGRSFLTLFRKRLVVEQDPERPVESGITLAHEVSRSFARHTSGVPQGSVFEGLFDMPVTAHILGGCPMARDVSEGVVDKNCQVFNYPGLFVVDGSVVPANPGVNPSLTITAIAEYAMEKIDNIEVVSTK